MSSPLRFQRLLRRAVIVSLCVCCAPLARAVGPEDDAHAHEHEHEDHGVSETIVVTGSPLEHSRDELAIPVERVDRRELLQNLGSTLGESINYLPGITTTGFAAGASRPVVRGQDAFRTEVLEDGLRTQDVSRESPDHAVPINPLAASRVEVVRGPATLRYGGAASAGVVNTITPRVPDQLSPEPVEGEVFGGIALVNDGRDIAARLQGTKGSFAWQADGQLRDANNYKIPNTGDPSTQTGSQFESYAGSVGGSYINDIGRIGVSYTRVESEYGIPEDEPVEIDLETDRFRFEGDLVAPIEGIREVRVRGVYSDYEHEEQADGVVGQIYRNEEFEGRLEAIHEPIAGFIGAVGVQGRTRDFRAEGEAAEFLAPSDNNEVAFYVFEERQLTDSLSAELGFRVEWNRVEGRDFNDLQRDRGFVPVSGAIGLVATPLDGLTIGAQTAISQRAPSQVELFARGPHEATSTFEIGDSGLDKETSYAGDLRVEFKNDRGRIEASGFVTLYDDFIFGFLTGNTVDEDGNAVLPSDPDALDELLYRKRDAVFYGGEIAGEVDVYYFDCGTVGLDGQLDFVRARFTRGQDRDLPRIVPMRWGGGLFFRNDKFEGRVGFRRTEAQNDISSTETRTASFTWVNASLSYRIGLLDDRIPVEFTATGRNLNDVRGRNHVSFNKDEVLLPGRDVRFGVRARF